MGINVIKQESECEFMKFFWQKKQQNDIKEKKQNPSLTIDGLTSLNNRAEFNRVLGRRRFECCYENHYMSVAIADIDYMKEINDLYGHEKSDEVIVSIANRLTEHCADRGQAFRCGGQEFAVIFMNQTDSQVLEVMEEFRKSVSNISFSFMPKKKQVTISIGIVQFEGDENQTIYDIFSHADEAMYLSKKAGRNCCTIYEK